MQQEEEIGNGTGRNILTLSRSLTVGKRYSVDEAFKLLPEVAYAKFDETVDVAFNLGVDPKHADQMVRGAIVLPARHRQDGSHRCSG